MADQRSGAAANMGTRGIRKRRLVHEGRFLLDDHKAALMIILDKQRVTRATRSTSRIAVVATSGYAAVL